jgi:hypothetical protein
MILAVLVACMLAEAGLAAEKPFEAKPIEHVVGRFTPVVYSRYTPNKASDQVVVLHSKVSVKQRRVWKFAKGSRIIPTRRHSKALWTVTTREDFLVIAKSPTVPKGHNTEVIVAGNLQKLKAGSGVGDGRVGRGTVPYLPCWRSIIKAQGSHVIVVNEYDVKSYYECIKMKLGFNYATAYCGGALLKAYPGRREMVVCGKNGSIKKMSGLAKHLKGLAIPIESGKVATFDTIGHGSKEVIGLGPRAIIEPVMRTAVTDAGKQIYDYVLRDRDVGLLHVRDGIADVIGDGTYATYFSGFLESRALVGLHHCFTAANITNKAKKEVPKTSLTYRLQKILGDDKSVFGYDTMFELPFSWVDKNKDGKPTPDEVMAWPPNSGTQSALIWAK